MTGRVSCSVLSPSTKSCGVGDFQVWQLGCLIQGLKVAPLSTWEEECSAGLVGGGSGLESATRAASLLYSPIFFDGN